MLLFEQFKKVLYIQQPVSMFRTVQKLNITVLFGKSKYAVDLIHFLCLKVQ